MSQNIFRAVVGLFAMQLVVGGLQVLAADPVTQPAAGRRAVPDAASQAATEKIVRDVFGKYSAAPPAARAATATRMIEQSGASTDDPVAQFVLLKDAADLAAGVGDAATAMRAADLIDASFVIDAGELKFSLLRSSAAVATGAMAKAAADEGMKLMDEAAELGNYDLAIRLIVPTEQAARSGRNMTVLLGVQNRAAEIRSIQVQAAKAKSAEAILAKTPNDPQANLNVGRFDCFIKGDWRGLHNLAKVSEPGLKAAALADLATPTGADQQVAVGDLWWDLALKDKEGFQKGIRRRAGYWYSQAAGSQKLTGLSRALVDKRLSEIPAAPPQAVAVAATPSNPVANPAPSPAPAPTPATPVSPTPAPSAAPAPPAPAPASPTPASTPTSPQPSPPAVASTANSNKPPDAKSIFTDEPEKNPGRMDPKTKITRPHPASTNPPTANPIGPPPGITLNTQRIDTTWMNSLTGERYFLKSDHTGQLRIRGGPAQTRFTWELADQTLTFTSETKDWKMVTVFDKGLSNPGKVTWVANGVNEDLGTIWRLSQLMDAVRGKQLVGRWKNLAAAGEYYLLFVDLSGNMVFPDGTSVGCAWNFEDDKLCLFSKREGDGFRMVIDLKDGIDKPGKAIWTSGKKTEDRGMVVRDSLIARPPGQEGAPVGLPVQLPLPPYLTPTTQPSGQPLLQATLLRTIPMQMGQNLSLALADAGKKIVATGVRSFVVLDSNSFQPIGSAVQYSDLPIQSLFWVSARVEARGRYLLTLGGGGVDLRVFDLTTMAQVGPGIHQPNMFSADISPGGAQITASIVTFGLNADPSNNSVTLWNAADDKPAAFQINRGQHTHAVRYSPDGKWIVTATSSASSIVQMWDAMTGSAVGPAIHFGNDMIMTDSLIFSPQGDRLAAASRHGRLQIWEPITGKILHDVTLDTFISAMVFSPDGTRLAAGGTAHVHPQDPHFTACKVYDVAAGNPITGLLEHGTNRTINGREHGMVFSDNGRYLLTRSGFDRTARIWDLSKSGALVVQLEHPGHVREAIFNHDGKVITTCSDGSLRVWELPREMVVK